MTDDIKDMLNTLFTVRIDKINQLIITAQGKFKVGRGSKNIVERKNIFTKLRMLRFD